MAAPTAGELFELRVASVLHGEGAFVRRRVNLDQKVGGRVQVTDIDVLAFHFDETIRLRLEAGECKTSEAKSAPSAKDRLLWLAGVTQLVGANGGFLATTRRARDDDRHLARSVGLDLVDPRDLDRREAILGSRTDVPAHSVNALALERDAAAAATKDEELRRVWSFARSELWLAEPVPALKRALGAMRIVGQRWSPALDDQERRVLRWLASETIIGFTLAVTRLAGESYRMPEDVFVKSLSERLAEGLASYTAMREISKQVDTFLVGVLRDAGVDDRNVVGAIGALAPRPPNYAEPLTELVQRLAAEPALTCGLPRLTEIYLLLELYGGDLDAREADGARLLRLLEAFIQRQGRLPEELTTALRRRPEAHGSAPAEKRGKSNSTGEDATPASSREDERKTRERLFDDSAASSGRRR